MSLYKKIFLAGLLVLYWGKITIHLSPTLSLSLAGTTTSVIVPLFVAYLFVKARLKQGTLPFSARSPLFLFCAFCLVSVAWTRGYDFFSFNIVILPSILAYIIFSDLLANDEHFLQEYFLPVLTIGSLLIVLRGFVDSSGILVNEGKLDSPYEHHTLIAMNLVFVLPLVLYSLVSDEKRKLFYAVSLVLMVLSVILCGSKVGLVALFLILLLWLLRFGGVRMRIIGVSAMLAGILFLLAIPVTHQRFVGLLSIGDDPYMITRTRIWDMTLSFVREHLLLGLGFSLKTFRETGIEHFGEALFFYEHPHNLFLQILAFLGITGLALSLWIGVNLAKKLLAMRRGEFSFMADCLMMSFGGLLFTNLVEGALNSGRLMLNIFLVFAAIDYLYKKTKDKPQSHTGL